MRSNVAVKALVLAGVVSLPGHVLASSTLLAVEAVSVSPTSPGPNVLCGLSVRLKNVGTKTATNFRFEVRIDGKDVSTYAIETYAVNVAPGTSETIELHSFWTAATRKASFPVEVSVLEAAWADVKRESSATTTTPVGPIEGLPVAVTQTVTMSAK